MFYGSNKSHQKSYAQMKKPADNSVRLAYFVTAFLIFLGGIALYAFFRNLNIVLFQFLPKPAILDTFYFPVSTDSIVISMLLYNLPDGLWFLSGLLVIRAIWLTCQKWQTIYCGIFFVIALSMEILQAFDVFPGTFDVLDIIFMAFFAFVENLVFFLFVKRSILC